MRNYIKKVTILIILISQLSWTFSSGFFVGNENRESCDKVSALEVRGFSSVIKVVHSNLVDCLKRVIELSCLVSQLPNPNNTKKDENE
ncbi:MAG: hypothetical protein ABID79_05930, partial [Elusimicrobiota bacterium]